MSGLFYQRDEGYNESAGDSMSIMDYNRNSTEMDKLSTKLALRRLLYRMERYEDLSILQGQEESKTTTTTAFCENNAHYQSWQSFLVRAQLCQTLWKKVASENVDEGSDPGLRKEYLELSQRVDVACKRAHVLAEQAREKDIAAGRDKDLVGKLFFSPSVSDDDEETETAEGGGAGDPRIEHDGEGNEYYDDFDDDGDDDDDNDDNDDEEQEHSAHGHSSRPSKNSRINAAEAPNLQDLQKAQREQIEEAIALMAKQMKESTQGIRKTLQKQNADTLNELETVAEQNMEDVSKVASNVKEHVMANQRHAWATWTTMILIVGVFAFTLLTIFAIPKHPDANLGRILSAGDENNPYARLVKKTFHKIKSAFDGDSKDDDDHEKTQDGVEEENWDDFDLPQDVLVDQEVQERLTQLVQDMQSGGRKTQKEQELEKQERETLKKQEQEKQEQEERFRKLQEELEQKAREQEELKKQEQLQLQQEMRREQEQLKKIKHQQQQQQQEEEEELRKEEERLRQSKLERLRQREEREKRRKEKLEEEERIREQKIEEEERLKEQVLQEEEKKRQEEQEQEKSEFSDNVPEAEPIFARDLRAAAFSNNYQALEHYLKEYPHLINEQDEDGWTALHLAVHAKHRKIVKLLLEQWYEEDHELSKHNINPKIRLFGENKETAFYLALNNYGLDHPVTEVFFETEWYDRSRTEQFVENEWDVQEDDGNYKGELPYSDENVSQRINYTAGKRPRGKVQKEDDVSSESDDHEVNEEEVQKEDGVSSESDDQEYDDEYEDEQENIEDDDDDDSYFENEASEEIESYEDENELGEESSAATTSSADDILASLKQRQAEPQAPMDPEKVVDDDNDEINTFTPPQDDREGVAARMVSPKDFRLAAASNDHETLQRYLEMAPQHINRQDKHGWTALHMAVHGGHKTIVLLLLAQRSEKEDMQHLNIDPHIESYKERRTALDLALEQYGLNHPITEAFFEYGWYERSDFEDWGDPKTRLRKQKLKEHEARIAKEKEAIKAKEERFAAAAEAERRVKQDKLDKLFGSPIEDGEDAMNEEDIEERRSRLDALLEEL